jgi:hypothetical protein
MVKIFHSQLPKKNPKFRRKKGKMKTSSKSGADKKRHLIIKEYLLMITT